MSFLSRIWKRDGINSVLTKSPNREAPILNPFFTNTPIFPTGDFYVFTEQGYLRNELVYAGIRKIMEATASAPLRVFDAKGNRLDNHPLRQLIRRPNPFMGENLLWQMTALYMHLSGNSFWEKVRSASGQVVELWPLRPDRMRIRPSNKNFIDGYVYEIAGKQFQLNTQDVIHFKFAHPLYDYWGLSPLFPALRRIAIDNESADYLKVTLQNLGVPPFLITVQQALDEATVDRLYAMLPQRWGGRNRGRAGFLQTGMDVKTIASPIKDMAMPELDEVSQKRVLASLGVPPILVGQESTFANYEQARGAFYEDTVSPFHELLDDKLEADLLFADFQGESLELRFDTSEVPALRSVRQLRWTNANQGVAAGYITVNEGRAMVGLPPIEGPGDVYLRPVQTVAVPVNGDEDDDDIPSEDIDSDEGDDEEKKDGINSVIHKKARRPKRDIAALNKIVLARNDAADLWIPKLKTMARMNFSAQAREVRRAFNARHKALTNSQVEEITAEIAALEAEWAAAAAASSLPIFSAIMTDAASSAATAELGIKFDLSNAQVMEFMRAYAYKFAGKISATSADDVRAVMTNAYEQGSSLKEISGALQGVFDGWDKARADLIAQTESIRAANGGAILSYKLAGITKKIWIADSEACPYCAALNGRVVEIDTPFLKMGDSFHPDGASSAMQVTYEDVGFPPAHPRCRCAVRAYFDEMAAKVLRAMFPRQTFAAIDGLAEAA